MSWSDAQEIEISSFKSTSDDGYYNLNNYSDANASWFQHDYWPWYAWGWIYTNDTKREVKVNKVVFKACAGHSGGKSYCCTPDGQLTKSWGAGCKFTSDLYVLDKNNKKVGSPVLNAGSGSVASINSFNCSAGGVAGNTDTVHQWTVFGDPALFSGNKAWHDVPFDYSKNSKIVIPKIPIGGKLIVVAHPLYKGTNPTEISDKAWDTSKLVDGGQSLLVLKGSGANFSSVVTPADDEYIWVYTGTKWEKKKKARQMTKKGWVTINKN